MSTSRVFVSGLYPGVKDQDLVGIFNKYGEVLSVEVKERKMDDGSVHNTFAFLDLKTSQSKLTECFYQLNGLKFRGHEIRVQPAKESFLDRLKKERLQLQQNNVFSSSPTPSESNKSPKKESSPHSVDDRKQRKRTSEGYQPNQSVNGDYHSIESTVKRESQSAQTDARIWYPNADTWMATKLKTKSSESSGDTLFPCNVTPGKSKKAKQLFKLITAENGEETEAESDWASFKQGQQGIESSTVKKNEVELGKTEEFSSLHDPTQEPEEDSRFKLDETFFIDKKGADVSVKKDRKRNHSTATPGDHNESQAVRKSKKTKLPDNEAGLKDSLAQSGGTFSFSSMFGTTVDNSATASNLNKTQQTFNLLPKILEQSGDEWKPLDEEQPTHPSRRPELVFPEDKAESFFFSVADRRFNLATSFFQRQEEAMDKQRHDWQRRRGDLLNLCKRASKKAIKKKEQERREASTGIRHVGQTGRHGGFSFRFSKHMMKRNDFLKLAMSRVKSKKLQNEKNENK